MGWRDHKGAHAHEATEPKLASLAPRARVALITEGTYPFVTGGVSTWCDQIVRGLPEHDFSVVAVVAANGRDPVWELPSNLVSVETVPLWSWVPTVKAPRGDALRRFEAAFRPFVTAMVDNAVDDSMFVEGLRGLFEYAQRESLTAALMSDSAAELLSDIWETSRSERVTVYEVLKALELLEHSMRPLSAPVIEADLCHATSNGLPSLLAILAKWRHGTPFIMSEHGVYLRERYLAFQEFACPWLVKYVVLSFFRRLTRLAYAEASCIAPVNVYNQRWEMEHGADPDVIVTALNGVDVSKYPVAVGEPDEQIVAWVGRVDPLKDLETLVETFARLVRQVPAAVLQLYGPVPVGNEEYFERVKDLIARRDLRHKVRFMGPVSPVSTAYHNARVVVLSSISEGLPYTVIEAMMCGRATVSTDVGGVREVVGDAGLLVRPRDPRGMAVAIEMLLTDDEMRADLAARSTERGRSYFRLEQMIGTFRAEYSLLISPEDPQFSPWPETAAQLFGDLDPDDIDVPENGLSTASLITSIIPPQPVPSSLTAPGGAL